MTGIWNVLHSQYGNEPVLFWWERKCWGTRNLLHNIAPWKHINCGKHCNWMSHPRHNIFLNTAKQSNSTNNGEYLPALSVGSSHNKSEKLEQKCRTP